LFLQLDVALNGYTKVADAATECAVVATPPRLCDWWMRLSIIGVWAAADAEEMRL